jgi:hypothetical protein
MKKATGKPNWPKPDSAPAQQHLRPERVRCPVPPPTNERGPLISRLLPLAAVLPEHSSPRSPLIASAPKP